MELNREEMQELIALLQVAYNDATTVADQSHDSEEVQAYKQHKHDLFKWIVRLSKEVEPKN